MKTDITGMSDMLETVSVLRSAKNLFFTVSLMALLVLGAIFVLSRMDRVNYPWEDSIDKNVACSDEAVEELEQQSQMPALAAVVGEQAAEKTEDIEQTPATDAVEELVEVSTQPEVIEQQAAEAVASTIEEALSVSEAAVEETDVQDAEKDITEQQGDIYEMEKEAEAVKWQMSWRTASSLIRLCNAALVFSLTLYCFSLLICLKLTLVGRLGAAYYITSGMFLSMFAAVIFMPWQAAFPGVGLAGAMYMPYELACATINYEKLTKIGAAMFYARYAGLWLVVLLALIMAQGRSMCWAARTTANMPDA
ncbi:MAG: hypothetical protein ACIAQZ_02665 [Sedimentisphaeraceae bacterium JB056]